MPVVIGSQDSKCSECSIFGRVDLSLRSSKAKVQPDWDAKIEDLVYTFALMAQPNDMIGFAMVRFLRFNSAVCFAKRKDFNMPTA